MTDEIIEMTDLQKYEAVNKTETLDELAEVIISFGDALGFIQGRKRIFRAESMAVHCQNFSALSHNKLTREFGIRQQAFMLAFYQEREYYKN